MSVTIGKWGEDFKTLDTKQQQAIVRAILTLTQWPLFKEQYQDSGLFQLGAGFAHIAYKGKLALETIDLLLK